MFQIATMTLVLVLVCLCTEGLGSDSQTLINATFALTTIGQIALLLLGATLLFSHGPQARRATLVNVVIVTLFSTIPPYLLYAPHLL